MVIRCRKELPGLVEVLHVLRGYCSVGILHVPLNVGETMTSHQNTSDFVQVPALGVTLREDNVKLDRELVGHGVSNLAAGLVGTVSSNFRDVDRSDTGLTGAKLPHLRQYCPM